MEFIIKVRGDREFGFWSLMAQAGFDLCYVCNCIVEFDEGKAVDHDCCE